MTEETMASTKLLSLGPLLSYFLDTSSAFTAMETPNLFLPSIASPWMDNFYKCILYGCVPSSVSSIFSTSLSGTRQKWRRHFAINAAESSNYVRWNGKIPQFDYILRISSLINTKHRYIYIYTRIRRDAIWSDVELSGNLLSKDSSRWMHIIALFLPEFWIRGPFRFLSSCAPRVDSFLSLLIFPLLIYRSFLEFSRGSQTWKFFFARFSIIIRSF